MISVVILKGKGPTATWATAAVAIRLVNEVAPAEVTRPVVIVAVEVDAAVWLPMISILYVDPD
jgi:hypothetical protein